MRCALFAKQRDNQQDKRDFLFIFNSSFMFTSLGEITRTTRILPVAATMRAFWCLLLLVVHVCCNPAPYEEENINCTDIFVHPCARTFFCEECMYSAHLEDCTAYYQCVYGTWQERLCPDDLRYDYNVYQCLNPEDVSCFSDSCEDGCPDVEPPPGFGEDTNTTVPVGLCPEHRDLEECVAGYFYPDEVSCIHYYECAPAGIIDIPVPCADGLVLHLERDEEANSQCAPPYPGFSCFPRCQSNATTVPPPPEECDIQHPALTTAAPPGKSTTTTPPPTLPDWTNEPEYEGDGSMSTGTIVALAVVGVVAIGAAAVGVIVLIQHISNSKHL